MMNKSEIQEQMNIAAAKAVYRELYMYDFLYIYIYIYVSVRHIYFKFPYSFFGNSHIAMHGNLPDPST